MSTSEAVSDALEDLQGAIVAGQSVDAAIEEIAQEYGIKPDVLRARASREGGVVESAERLRRQSHLMTLVQRYDDEGHLLRIPKLGFAKWYENEFSSSVTSADLAFVDREISRRLSRAKELDRQETEARQNRWFKDQKQQLYRMQRDAEDR